MLMLNNKCKNCDKVLKGRLDKQFCNTKCKGAYHYKLLSSKPKTTFKLVDEILKNNRKILKKYNQSGKSVVRKETLLKEGFNSNYFTNVWKNKNGNHYFFCYEYGYLPKEEHNIEKYVLVQWQNYMH